MTAMRSEDDLVAAVRALAGARELKTVSYRHGRYSRALAGASVLAAGFLLVVAIAAVRVALQPGQGVGALATPALSATTRVTATSTASVKIETPLDVLQLTLGGADRPGVGPEPFGVTPRGPISFAVEGDTVFVLDQVNARVLLYRGGVLVRGIALDGYDPYANGLLIAGDRLYLRSLAPGEREYEYDLAGRLLRSVPVSAGVTIYPRVRPTYSPGPGKSQAELGTDSVGRTYTRAVLTQCAASECIRISRLSKSGVLETYASEPLGTTPVDFYVSSDGGVHELLWGYDAGQPRTATVRRLLSAAP
jgi:hypothetical protein